MAEYNENNVKLSDAQLRKLKNVVKNKTGTTLRISLKRAVRCKIVRAGSGKEWDF